MVEIITEYEYQRGFNGAQTFYTLICNAQSKENITQELRINENEKFFSKL